MTAQRRWRFVAFLLLPGVWCAGQWLTGLSPWQVYNEGLVTVVNAGLALQDLPLVVAGTRDGLTLHSGGIDYRIGVAGQELFGAGALATVALFALWPLRRRVVWTASAVVLLFGCQAVGLYGQVYAAVGEMMASLPAAQRAHLLTSAWAGFDADRAVLWQRTAGLCVALGGPGLVLLVWLQALPERFWQGRRAASRRGRPLLRAAHDPRSAPGDGGLDHPRRGPAERRNIAAADMVPHP